MTNYKVTITTTIITMGFMVQAQNGHLRDAAERGLDLAFIQCGIDFDDILDVKVEKF